MKTQVKIRNAGMRRLINALGIVEAKRFVALMSRERLDDTEWRKTRWSHETWPVIRGKI